MNDSTVELLLVVGVNMMSVIAIGVGLAIMSSAPTIAWTLIGSGVAFPVVFIVLGVLYGVYKLVKMLLKK